MPFDATVGPALRRGGLNEVHVAAAAAIPDVLAAISARLRASGFDPQRARWVAPVGQQFDVPLMGYSPRTPREATWAMERALTLTTGEPVVVAWLPSNPIGKTESGRRRDDSDRLLRRLRALARAHGTTAVVLRQAR